MEKRRERRWRRGGKGGKGGKGSNKWEGKLFYRRRR